MAIIIKTFDNENDWMEARAGRVTGSRVEDVLPKTRGEGKRKGFYELIAERLGVPADGENPMDRGHRLEVEAIERFSEATGKKVDPSLVIWMREDNDRMAVSPDGVVEGGKEAVEVKSLNSASHLEAYLTGEIPKAYLYQAMQYMVVNDDLERVHVVFYDPRLRVADYFVKTIERKDVLSELENLSIAERTVLAEVDAIVDKLTEL